MFDIIRQRVVYTGRAFYLRPDTVVLSFYHACFALLFLVLLIVLLPAQSFFPFTSMQAATIRY